MPGASRSTICNDGIVDVGRFSQGRHGIVKSFKYCSYVELSGASDLWEKK